MGSGRNVAEGLSMHAGETGKAIQSVRGHRPCDTVHGASELLVLWTRMHTWDASVLKLVGADVFKKAR